MLPLPKLTKCASCFFYTFIAFDLTHKCWPLPSSFLCLVQGTVCITLLLQKKSVNWYCQMTLPYSCIVSVYCLINGLLRKRACFIWKPRPHGLLFCVYSDAALCLCLNGATRFYITELHGVLWNQALLIFQLCFHLQNCFGDYPSYANINGQRCHLGFLSEIA